MIMIDYLGVASNVIGIASALFALMAWLQARRTQRELAAERQRLNERIEVALILDGGNGRRLVPARRPLPVALRRAELTRAELLGRLGMLPMREAGRRFSLDYLATPSFLDDLARAQTARGAAEIVIPCSESEFAQFALGRWALPEQP